MWRWRIELIVLTVVVSGWVVLAERVPGWAAGVIEVAVVAVVLVIPASRRYVVRRVWCVISRHRVRKCFVQSRVMTHEGRLPLFVWTRPTPVGERVRLWLRPGLSARDIESAVDRIAVACWAREARVETNPDRVSTVWVHVIRRDPLATTGQIRSPLLRGVPLAESDQDTERTALPDRATVLATLPHPGLGDLPQPGSHPATATKARAMPRTPTRTTGTDEQTASPSAVTSRFGEDVSDYV